MLKQDKLFIIYYNVTIFVVCRSPEKYLENWKLKLKYK